MSQILPADADAMEFAIQLAGQGLGFVEPNPMVGAVIIGQGREVIASGYHQRFGGAHAEIHAIQSAGARTRGAELYVTLEPCSHFGKTPPCADAVLAAGFRRVVIGCQDPAPHVAGRGIQKLRDGGVEVVVGVCQSQAERLIAPFRRVMLDKRPWLIAKWAMTLDGRIATRTGASRWISCEASRRVVHDLRGRVDAIMTGSGTVRADDPELTARPSGPRTPVRVVFDSSGRTITRDSRLVRSIEQGPILICVSRRCDDATRTELDAMGLEVFPTRGESHVDGLEVMQELYRRGCTNVMLEAGPALLGAFFDQHLVDEVKVFVAPKIVGGQTAPGPIGGLGIDTIPAVANLQNMRTRQIDCDLLIEADLL
ncbi:MAG: bifunctional diaminohydroxyphosphoribosylaminopyrimidine deaminase/5-amino-6-(5-phosphoribosylamino)uracil reductase RibD [Planctomycetota bacterium]